MTTSYIGSSLITQKLTELETAMSVANTAISDSNLSIAAANNKVSTLESWSTDRVKYAYPNGGSKGSESQLSLSSVYVVASPFGVGVNFHSIPEYLSPVTLQWEEMSKGFYGGQSDTYGVVAYSRVESGLAVLTTANTAFGYGVVAYGAGWEGLTNPEYNAAKWRIKCVRQD